MEQLLNSINTLFQDNYSEIGLDSLEGLSFKSEDFFNIKDFPFISVYLLKNSPQKRYLGATKEKNLAIFQIDIYAKNDYYKESTSKLSGERITQNIRDKIYGLLRNRTIARHNFNTEIDEGSISFKYQDEEPFSLNSGIKAISMTYHVYWEKPI